MDFTRKVWRLGKSGCWLWPVWATQGFNCFKYQISSHTRQEQTKLGLKLIARSGCTSISEQMWAVLPSVLESVLMAGKASQQDAVMSSSLNTTPYQCGCHGFTDWNGTAERWYSLEFLSHQIPNPHLALVLIFQQLGGENHGNWLKVEVPRQRIHFQNSEHFFL